MTMRRAGLLAMLLALGSTGTVLGAEQEFTTGDGTRFVLSLKDGIPGRAETERAIFESAGFSTDTAAAPTITDRFDFHFKGGNQPVRVRVEDVTLPGPVLLAEAIVPEDLPGAGFRRSRFVLQAPPCPIARGEPCSAWMFGTQPNRLYRATLVFADGGTETLLQAEPYVMSAFVARLGDRIPTRDDAPARTAQSQ
ncbi:MAG: hypothetical protein ACK5Q0_00265 [Lysobacteraceae bacterium]